MKRSDVEIKCTCGGRLKQMARLPKMTGVQWDRYAEGYYTLYECFECEDRYWEYGEK